MWENSRSAQNKCYSKITGRMERTLKFNSEFWSKRKHTCLRQVITIRASLITYIPVAELSTPKRINDKTILF